jgi:hypothetical protein
VALDDREGALCQVGRRAVRGIAAGEKALVFGVDKQHLACPGGVADDAGYAGKCLFAVRAFYRELGQLAECFDLSSHLSFVR